LAHQEAPSALHNSPPNYHNLTIKKPHFPTRFFQNTLKKPSNLAKLYLSDHPQFFSGKSLAKPSNQPIETKRPCRKNESW
jgi:hypothetical protein